MRVLGVVHDGLAAIADAIDPGPIIDVRERPTPAPAADAADTGGEPLLRSLVANATDGLVVLDPIGKITYASPALGRVLGYEPGELLGQDVFGFVHGDDSAAIRAALATLASRDEGAMTFELRARHRDDTWRWLEVTATNLQADPAVGGIVMSVRDVSERRLYEDDLRHRALHDTLTGLPNRALLLDRLEGALGRSGRESRSVALFFLDVDGFKVVNDTLGHSAGDDVLVGVARRLSATARGEDTVARYGGDEFVVVVEHAQDPDWVVAFADRLRAVFREPVRAGGRLVPVTASLGIASAQGGGGDPEALLRHADAAMYRAKQSGGDAYEMFEASMLQDVGAARD